MDEITFSGIVNKSSKLQSAVGFKKMETFDEKINLDEMVILKEDANFIFLGVDVDGKKCEYVVQKPQTVIYDHEEFENIFGTDVYEKIMTVREMEVNARKSPKD